MTVTAAPPVAPPEARRRRPRASGARPSRALWLFAAPALLLHTYFLAAPALQTLLYSVTDWDGYSADFAWVGVDNYTGLLTADDQFRNAAVNSLQFTLVVTIAQTLISLALAVQFPAPLEFLEFLAHLRADFPMGTSQQRYVLSSYFLSFHSQNHFPIDSLGSNP